jgi:RND family efflux transporter MFP subunit
MITRKDTATQVKHTPAILNLRLAGVFVWLAIVVFPFITQAQETGQVRGLIVSEMRTTLAAQISANIDAINVDMGESFSKGETLVQLNADIPQARVERLQAELKGARHQLEANRRLMELNSVSTLELLQSEAMVEQKEKELKLERIYVRQCAIKAPFAGRVVERLVSPHQYVTPGTPLLDVIAHKNLRVQAFVPSHWLTRVHIGQMCTLHVDEISRSFPARITSLGARIDSNSQMLQIYAEIEDVSGNLLAGMSGRLDFSAVEREEGRDE